MGLEELKKEALVRLNDCRECIVQLAMDKESAIRKVLDIPAQDLPLHVNEPHSLTREMILARLRKEDLTKNYKFVLHSLYDIAFDTEEYKDIGFNDGALSTLAMIFRELGDAPHEIEALNWVYSD